MDHGKIQREFVRYAAQNIMGMVGLSCYILADTFFISQGLGPDGLTALNLALPCYSLIQGLGLMLGMGGATRFSILRGQGREGEAQEVFTQALFFALAVSLLFAVPGSLLAPKLGALLGAQGAVHGMTTTYLRVMMLFAPMFLVNNVMLCFVRNDSAPRLAMLAMLGGSISNIVLDFLFIFPLGMGMLGAILATGLAPVISLSILSPHFRHRTLRLRGSGFRVRGIGGLSVLGLPSLVSELSSGLVLMLFNFIILHLAGNLGVAGYGVVANIYLVVLALFTGLAQGIQPLVSAAQGREDEWAAGTVYRYAVWTAVGVGAAVYVVTFLFAQPIAAIFNRELDPVLQEVAVRGLRLYFSAFFFSGFNVVTAVYFSSTERPASGFVISFLRGFALIVPCALLMSRLWGMDGVWLSAPAAEAVTALAAVWIILTGKRHGK